MANDELAAAIDALPPGWRGRFYEALDSTQDEARAAAHAGAPSRFVFVANYQRAGRGRQGRSWLAAPGAALLLSVLFREEVRAPRPWRWTSLVSVALIEALEQRWSTLRPSIKWPNDVLLDGRKVAGVLAESSWDGRQLVAIVGIGVNVRTAAADLARLGSGATSLRQAVGHDLDRGELLLALVERMDRCLDLPWPTLHDAWAARLWGRGQRLRMLDLGREEVVVVLGAESDGSLRVQMPDGSVRLTTTGELIL